MTRLSDIIKPGDIVATDNVEGYEGNELAVYLGVKTKRGEGLLVISWITTGRSLYQVFTSDFNKFFYPVRLVGFDRNQRMIYKRIKRRFTHTDGRLFTADRKCKRIY